MVNVLLIRPINIWLEFKQGDGGLLSKNFFFSKFELLDDYDHPPPIPQDLLIQHSLQANQGYVIIGTKQSGQN
jgi:hypothetical protein